MIRNIIYHHRTQGYGAEGIHIKSIVEAFRILGLQVTIVSPPGVDPIKTAGEYLYNDKKDIWNKLWKLISKNMPQIIFEIFEVIYNFTVRAKLIQQINSEPNTLLFERYAFFMWIGSSVAKKNGIKYFLEVNEISSLQRARPLLLRNLASKIEQKVFQKADVIFVVSSLLKKQIVEMDISSDKILVLPNGVNKDFFDPSINAKNVKEKYSLNDKIAVGFVGWIDPWDNMPWLIKSFKNIVDQNENVVLMIVGDFTGKSEIGRLELERIIKKNKLTNNVILTGGVVRELIPKYIAAMDICLIPDSNPFGSPIVLLEFMSMAKPVIAPDLAPIRDVIQDGFDGIIFKKNNYEDFKKKLMKLVEDKKLRIILGDNARQKILNERTWEANAKAIHNLMVNL